MAKKINNYSWIHELNKAALSAQLLSEAKIYHMQILNEAKRRSDEGVRGGLGGGMGRQVAPGVSEVSRPSDVDPEGQFTPEERARYEAILKEKIRQNRKGDPRKRYTTGLDTEETAVDPEMMERYPSLARGFATNIPEPQSPQNLQVIDVNGNGTADAEDVKQDALNGVMGDEAVRQFFRASDADLAAGGQIRLRDPRILERMARMLGRVTGD